MKFEIVCDSSADLPQSYAESKQVHVVPFYVSMDGEHYFKEGVELPVRQFYEEMASHSDCYPKTSMPAIQDYMDTFISLVQKDMPVLCICLTQKFSGSMQSACNAKMAVEDEYPNAKIYVMDSQLVTALQGLLVQEAVRLRDLDLEMDRAIELLEEVRSTGQIFFTTKDLKYLEHGGRLSKAARVAGGMLDLKPVLHFHNGDLAPAEVSRGRKRSLQKIMDNFFDYMKEQQIDLSEYLFGTGIGLELPEYEPFRQMIEERFEEQGIHPAVSVKVQIGATIGVHTGPYPMGLGILKKCRA